MSNRLPPLAEQEWDVQQRQLAEEIINGPRGALLPPFEPLLRSPELMAHAQRMGSTCAIAARWASVFLNWRFC
jgi:4-carboxymuconolactone decarboxylase